MKTTGARVVAAVGLLGSLLAACGSSSAKKADGGGGGGSGGTVCADYAEKYCDRLQVCAPGFLAIAGFASVADCTAYYTPGCNDSLLVSHTGDTVALVQQCGDQLAAMSCTDLLQGSSAPACLPRGGTIPNGGSCNSNWQCASGRCAMSFTVVDNSIECGTCVAVVPLGQACDNSGFLGTNCADNLVCAVTTVGGTTPVCAKSLAIGGACADGAVCPANAYCDGTTHLCAQLPAAGQTCDPTMISYCDPTKAGALCDADSSLCKPITVAKVGESCAPPGDGTTVSCLGSCETPADAGPDAGSGACSPPVLEGEPCTDSDACVDSICSGGVCTGPVCGGEGTDAATGGAPPAGSAFARRKLIRLPATAFAPAFSARR